MRSDRIVLVFTRRRSATLRNAFTHCQAMIDLSLVAIVWISCGVFIASIISAATGMAGGVLMFAAMNTAIPVRQLVPIHGVVQIFNNAARSWFLRHHTRWDLCLPFTVGAVIGAAATTMFIVQYVSEALVLALLLGLILYTLFKPKRMPQLKPLGRGFFFVGLATGSMGIIAGAVDPLLGAFYFRDDLSKEAIVCNKSVMQLVTHLTKIPAFIYLGFVFSDYLGIIALFSVIAIIGTRVGVALLQRIDTRVFFIAMRIALALAALRITFQLAGIG